MTRASIIVINWNGAAFLEMCLKALLTQTTVEDEIIVVDNDSIDNSVEFVRSHFPDVELLCNEHNLGYAGGANVGLRAARGDVCILLNPDVEVHRGWLRALKDVLVDKGVGVAGCKLYYPGEEIIQHAGGIIRYPLAAADHHGYRQRDEGQWDGEREVDYVTGAALALRRDVLDGVGLFDEGFCPAYYEEVDFCFRVRDAGYQVRYVPEAVATHHEHAALGEESYAYIRYFHRNRLRFVLKHRGPQWFVKEFVPAEKAWVREGVPSRARRAFSSVYLEVLLDYPRWEFARPAHLHTRHARAGQVGGARVGAPQVDGRTVSAVLEGLAQLRASVRRK
jgi:GT2 family glycosyltransferase